MLRLKKGFVLLFLSSFFCSFLVFPVSISGVVEPILPSPVGVPCNNFTLVINSSKGGLVSFNASEFFSLPNITGWATPDGNERAFLKGVNFTWFLDQYGEVNSSLFYYFNALDNFTVRKELPDIFSNSTHCHILAYEYNNETMNSDFQLWLVPITLFENRSCVFDKSEHPRMVNEVNLTVKPKHVPPPVITGPIFERPINGESFTNFSLTFEAEGFDSINFTGEEFMALPNITGWGTPSGYSTVKFRGVNLTWFVSTYASWLPNYSIRMRASDGFTWSHTHESIFSNSTHSHILAYEYHGEIMDEEYQLWLVPICVVEGDTTLIIGHQNIRNVRMIQIRDYHFDHDPPIIFIITLQGVLIIGILSIPLFSLLTLHRFIKKKKVNFS
ncbi:MAG: hypothetical protein ACTSUV_02410 [Candidatus Ranarchaeia archaeon]